MRKQVFIRDVLVTLVSGYLYSPVMITACIAFTQCRAQQTIDYHAGFAVYHALHGVADGLNTQRRAIRMGWLCYYTICLQKIKGRALVLVPCVACRAARDGPDLEALLVLGEVALDF